MNEYKIKKNQSIKISTVAIIALLIPFILLIFSENIWNEDFSKNSNEIKLIEEKKLFFKEIMELIENNSSNQRNIFLLGSSHVIRINATQVNELILDEDVKIYNLGISADQPTTRLNDLDKIISTNPEIVVYGISYRDFEFPYQNLPPLNFPEPQYIFYTQLGIGNIFDSIFPSNPQWLTKNILKDIVQMNPSKINKQEKIIQSNTPFFEYDKEPKIKTNKDLKKMKPTLEMSWTDTNPKMKNIYALDKIITELHNHEIKVIIFTTPLHEYYLNSLSDSQKNQFLELKKQLTEKHKIKIYNFEEKYNELNIWADISHISYHRNATEYNKDIAEIISMEMNP